MYSSTGDWKGLRGSQLRYFALLLRFRISAHRFSIQNHSSVIPSIKKDALGTLAVPEVSEFKDILVPGSHGPTADHPLSTSRWSVVSMLARKKGRVRI